MFGYVLISSRRINLQDQHIAAIGHRVAHFPLHKLPEDAIDHTINGDHSRNNIRFVTQWFAHGFQRQFKGGRHFSSILRGSQNEKSRHL